METSSFKIVLVTLLLIGALAAHGAANSSRDSSAECSKQKFKGPLGRFIRNVDLVLDELRAKTPVDGNFEHVAESKGRPKVFGRASCFSSLTTSVHGCTSCLDKAIGSIKSQCKTSIRASAGSASAGCSIRYDNVRIKA